VRPNIVMLMDTSDETLAEAAARADRDAFSALLSRHYDRIYGLAFRLTGSRAEAEDLTQDICMALPGKLVSYRRQARFTTWLYRVTVNAAFDRRRRTATRAKAADGWGDWELARQAELSEAAKAQDWLARTMRTLPVELRDTVALTLGGELSQAEAAEVLGVSEGTVAWRMSEVKKRLRAVAKAEGML
jgi:RNA polymerase sigma-70 factor (ECF subfamily)